MDESVPASSKQRVRIVGDELRYGLRFLRKHAWRIVLWFVGLLLPLWGFASLVGELHERKGFPFDAPVLNMLHALATPTLDRFFALTSKLGYLWGVVPLDLMVLLWLALRRRFRDGLFFGSLAIDLRRLRLHCGGSSTLADVDATLEVSAVFY